jgi:ornithine cyclodeaminase/alanine dehydrogenase-like protein (mu-crystallin family)
VSDDKSVLLINRTEVRRLLTWPELLAATRTALIATAMGGETVVTSSTQLVVPDASLHLKAGALAQLPTMSVKANLRPNAGRASGAILAFDLEQMKLHAILASADLTAMRTAAIAAVAAQALLVQRPVRVALLGAGPVAQRVLEVLSHLELLSEVTVWSRNVTRAQAVVDAAPDGPRAWATDDVQAALNGAALVVTCTPSRAPLFEAEHLHPHAVILAMGADTAGKQELPPSVLEAAVVYTDVREDALRVGESSHLSEEAADRVRDLGLFLDDSTLPQTSHTGWTVFDSVGSSAADVVAVSLVVRQAESMGLGQRVQLND